MGKVTSGFSMSLDGFVAGPHDGPEQPMGEGGDRLFEWYFTGDASVEIPSGNRLFKMTEDGAELVRSASQAAGVLVTGRRTFDLAGAWGGQHPMNVPVVVVTHRVPREWVKVGSPFTFVTDGVESAIDQAQRIAGDKDVVVGGPSILKQCLSAGLLDEIHIDLIPVLLGAGVRLFEPVDVRPVGLEIQDVNPMPGVTHLTYRVIRQGR